MAHATLNSKPKTKNGLSRGSEKNTEDVAIKGTDGNASTTEIVQTQPPAPDGGWGWFVVFASFMIHIITDGMTYSFGVFYLELLYYFEEGKGATAWIASILVGVTLCVGPISGSLVNKYGCRTVTIAGSILASGCLLASVWAKNIITLYFTIGIGTGLGFGLIYLPAIVSVTCYFEKYRSLATGIAVCGSGLGTLLFAPFIEYLIGNYGWRGAIMICAGIVLNCIVFGALFRPIETQPVSPKNPLLNESTAVKATVNGKSHGPVSISGIRSAVSGSARSMEDTTDYMSISLWPEEPRGRLRLALSQPMLIPKLRNGDPNPISKSFGSSGVMNRRDALYQGSLDNLVARNQTDSPASRFENNEATERLHSSLKNLERRKTREENIEKLVVAEKRATDILREMLDFSLLKEPIFLLFTLSNFCTSIGFNIPYVYLLPQAEARGIEKTVASYLLSVIGVANTIGRIILGYVSDKPWVNRLLVYNVCLTVCGISTAISAFCDSFLAFATYCVVYGFTAGAYVGLTSVILVDLLGLNRLTSSFGLLLLFQGFASLLGPPIAGWLYDALGTYDPGFYTAGGMIAVSGLMLFFIPMLQRRIDRRRRELAVTSEKI